MPQNNSIVIAGKTPTGAYVALPLVTGGTALVTTSTGAVPTGAAQITGASGSVAAASAVATLAGAASKTTYITGFTVTAAGATAGASVSLAITGLLGGTLTYVYTAPTGATVPGPVLNVQFPTPLPASAVNTDIVVTLPSLGSGNLAAAVVATGYQV